MEVRITKKAMREFVRAKLANDGKWATRALVKLYERQTCDEQFHKETKVWNAVGFTGADAELLSSFAEGFRKYGSLTAKQMAWLHRKIVKYSGQVLDMCDKGKLTRLMERA